MAAVDVLRRMPTSSLPAIQCRAHRSRHTARDERAFTPYSRAHQQQEQQSGQNGQGHRFRGRGRAQQDARDFEIGGATLVALPCFEHT